MALPVLKKAADCVEFSHTVRPYLYQLPLLPRLIADSISDVTTLKTIYLDTNPLISAFAFSLFLSVIFLVVSEINRNYSQVDRMWSILPTVYIAHYTIYAHLSDIDTKRLDTLLAASFLWSCRLTFNYWRKGGYSVGSEDYRWEVLRKYINPLLFFLFNVFFISLAQSLLLFLITTPTYVMLLASGTISRDESMSNWTTGDLIASSLMVAVVLLAFVADQQQWNYHEAKEYYQKNAKVPPSYEQDDLDRGFLARGFWGYSRHPNFAAEQSFWIGLYQWASFLTGSVYNWTSLAPVAYLGLFQASTWFTELITAKKYPDYKEYQQKVPMFIPKIWNGPIGDNWSSNASHKKTDGDLQKEKEKEKDAAKARERYSLR